MFGFANPRTRARTACLVAIACLGLAVAGAARMLDDPSAAPKAAASPRVGTSAEVKEALSGFDGLTNGFERPEDYKNDVGTFSEEEDNAKGLGPVYNSTSCVSCHRNPIPGGSSQIDKIRAGIRVFDPADPSPHKVRFEEPPGGSVIQQRAIDASIQDMVLPEYDVRTLRTSNSILGNGFIEVIPDEELLRYRDWQHQFGMEGFAVLVPVPVSAKQTGTDARSIEFTFTERIGRFGWKCQEASLLNFSAGAYVTEMGITNPMQMNESRPNGRDVSAFDNVPEPEDTIKDDDPKKPDHLFGNDVEAFTRFMRSTKVPPRDTAVLGRPEVIEGEALFRDNKLLGCAVCHRPDYTTPAPGTAIVTLGGKQGSDLNTVPDALGNKMFHPFSDFLLHDVGTGDGIAQTQHADVPGRGQGALEKIPEKTRTNRGIGRVNGGTKKGDRRILKPTEGVDQRTANKVRTAPLWGLRTKPQMLHDGSALTVEDAILRHGGQAEGVQA